MSKKSDIEAGVAHIIVEIIEYVPNSVVTRTILNKTTGTVTVMSVDAGECLLEKKSPYDTFVQVIDGEAEILLEGTSHFLSTGQGLTIPAHQSNSIHANERFKMIMTLIKSGY